MAGGGVALIGMTLVPLLSGPVSYTHLDVYKRQPMTVKRSLNELETAGLIMRVRQGVGEPNRIYVLIPGKEDTALA